MREKEAIKQTASGALALALTLALALASKWYGGGADGPRLQ
eukprot:CAMPEP_0206447436 /NCGR_PEP_ID=MMETSP0324_2-20121206/16804_1 /ASSEMBLY_ACC=CAM_ASM_000836 /TAXON_ID=2866 /ORGANISM="Crypthecodinium cohnii, Strain Seligo" /LENGTH=40 /DNA_ID= /DNA_START= /DNA_END= /DNA_ORIENTATION=